MPGASHRKPWECKHGETAPIDFCAIFELWFSHPYQKKIAECDKQIAAFLKQQINTDSEKKKLKTTDKTHKRVNKNALKGIDLNQSPYQYFGGMDF